MELQQAFEALTTLSLIGLAFVGLVTSRAIYFIGKGVAKNVAALVDWAERKCYGSRRIQEFREFMDWHRKHRKEYEPDFEKKGWLDREIAYRVAIYLLWEYEADPESFHRRIQRKRLNQKDHQELGQRAKHGPCRPW